MKKFVRFSLSKEAEATSPNGVYGLLEGDRVVETSQLFGTEKGAGHAASAVRFLPPVLPSKIICVGRNYVDHAKELGNDVPTEPLIFLKPLSSLITHGDAIVYPPQSSRVDFEGEIGLIISKRGRHIRPEDAMDHVFGYTCVNDVTARDLQKKDGQWTRGKGFDTFCSVGPWMVSKEDFDLSKTTLRTMLNGELKQEGTPGQMIFDVGAILAFVSSFLTLEPGDLIATGTPAGVGPMQPGDHVTVEVEGLGALTNTVIKG